MYYKLTLSRCDTESWVQPHRFGLLLANYFDLLGLPRKAFERLKFSTSQDCIAKLVKSLGHSRECDRNRRASRTWSRHETQPKLPLLCMMMCMPSFHHHEYQATATTTFVLLVERCLPRSSWNVVWLVSLWNYEQNDWPNRSEAKTLGRISDSA